MVNVEKVADQLDFLANHFVEEPWKVDGPEKEVKGLITSATISRNKLTSRVKESFKWLTQPKSSLDELFYDIDSEGISYWVYKVKANISMAKFVLKKDINCPDYSLRDGTVVAVWAETGDYLISVQPAVGDKVAKFLREDPTNPHAVEIAEEIQKAWDAAFPDLEEKTMFKGTE